MNDQATNSTKPVFLMRYCTGECPGFQSLNLGQLIICTSNDVDKEI